MELPLNVSNHIDGLAPSLVTRLPLSQMSKESLAKGVITLAHASTTICFNTLFNSLHIFIVVVTIPRHFQGSKYKDV